MGSTLAIAAVTVMTVAALAAGPTESDPYAEAFHDWLYDRTGWYLYDVRSVRLPRWRLAHPDTCPHARDLTTASEMADHRILRLEFNCHRGMLFGWTVESSPWPP